MARSNSPRRMRWLVFTTLSPFDATAGGQVNAVAYSAMNGARILTDAN
jgi:hypothetical protein